MPINNYDNIFNLQEINYLITIKSDHRKRLRKELEDIDKEISSLLDRKTVIRGDC